MTSAVAVIVGFTLSLALSPALSEFDSFDSLLLECSSFVQGRILIRPRAVACEMNKSGLRLLSAELVLQLSFNLSAHFLYKMSKIAMNMRNSGKISIVQKNLVK